MGECRVQVLPASCLPHHLCIHAHRRMRRSGRSVSRPTSAFTLYPQCSDATEKSYAGAYPVASSSSSPTLMSSVVPANASRPDCHAASSARASASAESGTDTATSSEEHTSELQSLMRISYAVFCLKKKNINMTHT